MTVCLIYGVTYINLEVWIVLLDGFLKGWIVEMEVAVNENSHLPGTNRLFLKKKKLRILNTHAYTS